MENKKKCFVIMPFSKTKSCTEEKWKEIYNYIIKQAVEESGLGYECERSVAGRENIIKSILDSLNKANVVIADLTDNNPNVFYELGVRHTLANRTILIAQGEEHIPFDLKPYPIAFYSESPAKIAEFKKGIKENLEDIEKNPERSDNPVADFLRLKNIDISTFEKSANLKKLSALISEISYNISIADDVIGQGGKNKQARKEGKLGEISYINNRFSIVCVNLLLSTSYIMLSEELLKIIRGMKSHLEMLNVILDRWSNDMFTSWVEEKIDKTLPVVKAHWINIMKRISEFYFFYINQNYVEPEFPIICLSKQEHEQYLKPSK